MPQNPALGVQQRAFLSPVLIAVWFSRSTTNVSPENDEVCYGDDTGAYGADLLSHLLSVAPR